MIIIMNAILVRRFSLSFSIIYVNTSETHDKRTPLNLIKWDGEGKEEDQKCTHSSETTHSIISSEGTYIIIFEQTDRMITKCERDQ